MGMLISLTNVAIVLFTGLKYRIFNLFIDGKIIRLHKISTG
ncbi:hypothetical protein SAMN05421787_102493 [Virgibacillus pantothenticus]|nr:hypothetical protein SAMN05421787_102493 [Virgibacillus pantothenticus]